MSVHRSLLIALVAVLGLLTAACGDDGDDGAPFGDGSDLPSGDEADDLGDALGGGGGGGTLTFDGEEIEIAGATCQLGDDTFDVGTVSDNGFRVFVSLNNPANDVSAQILDADSVQWFPRDVQGDEAQREGSTFTAGPHTWFNNQNDETVEASFDVQCP